MWGAIKADLLDFVNTVTEDTTKTLGKVLGEEEEEEDVSLQEKLIADLRRSFETYELPIKQDEQKDFEKFTKKFNLSAYSGEIANVLDVEPEVSRYYAELVPIQITPEVFWARLFFRIQQVQRTGVANLVDDDDEEELTWENEEEGEGEEEGEDGDDGGKGAAALGEAPPPLLSPQKSSPAAESVVPPRAPHTAVEEESNRKQPARKLKQALEQQQQQQSKVGAEAVTKPQKSRTSDASTITAASECRSVSVAAAPITSASASQTDKVDSTDAAAGGGVDDGVDSNQRLDLNEHLEVRVKDLSEENDELKKQLAELMQRMAEMEASAPQSVTTATTTAAAATTTTTVEGTQQQSGTEEHVRGSGVVGGEIDSVDAVSDETSSSSPSAVLVSHTATDNVLPGASFGITGAGVTGAGVTGAHDGANLDSPAVEASAVPATTAAITSCSLSDINSNMDTEEWSRHSGQSGILVEHSSIQKQEDAVLKPTGSNFREETAKYLAALDDPEDEEDDGWN